MSSSRKFSFGRLKAKEVLQVLRIASPDEIVIEDIAWHRGALVQEIRMRGADGRSVRVGNRGIISVRQNIGEPGKKRFVAAHELGHFELHSKRDQLSLCLESDFLNWYEAARVDENEANEFAAELLLPEGMLKPMVHTLEPNFTAIGELAQLFRTSLTATAIRFIELSPYRCALVASENARIKWSKVSDNFSFFLRRGTPISKNTHAADYFEGNPLASGLHKVRADAWLEGPRLQRNIYIREESKELWRYKQVLTLLWIDEDIDTSDPDEDEPEHDPDYFTPDGKRYRW